MATAGNICDRVINIVQYLIGQQWPFTEPVYGSLGSHFADQIQYYQPRVNIDALTHAAWVLTHTAAYTRTKLTQHGREKSPVDRLCQGGVDLVSMPHRILAGASHNTGCSLLSSFTIQAN